jgi:hypothetical protein
LEKDIRAFKRKALRAGSRYHLVLYGQRQTHMAQTVSALRQDVCRCLLYSHRLRQTALAPIRPYRRWRPTW